ncbi:30S ribosomal protein S6e [Candidatus Woesearchaeota archaeon]|nr:30S ribosomal protein S6e [Candidatus Woesearchaeota archaeon]
MAEFKLILSNAKGQSVQKEIKDEQADSLMNKVIGDKVSGDPLGLTGYELQITGGSDKSGFPMRRDVLGRIRRKILTISSTGIHIKRKGIRKRKTVAGNTIYDGISQVNLKILKEGKESLFKPKESAEEAEKPEQKPEAKEEKKESAEKPEKKEEKKSEEKKAEKPVEQKPEKKAEQKAEEKKEAKPTEKKE